MLEPAHEKIDLIAKLMQQARQKETSGLVLHMP